MLVTGRGLLCGRGRVMGRRVGIELGQSRHTFDYYYIGGLIIDSL